MQPGGPGQQPGPRPGQAVANAANNQEAVRAKGVTHAPNTVLHPWLQTELEPIRAGLPTVTMPEAACPAAAPWARSPYAFR